MLKCRFYCVRNCSDMQYIEHVRIITCQRGTVMWFISSVVTVPFDTLGDFLWLVRPLLADTYCLLGFNSPLCCHSLLYCIYVFSPVEGHRKWNFTLFNTEGNILGRSSVQYRPTHYTYLLLDPVHLPNLCWHRVKMTEVICLLMRRWYDDCDLKMAKLSCNRQVTLTWSQHGSHTRDKTFLCYTDRPALRVDWDKLNTSRRQHTPSRGQ